MGLDQSLNDRLKRIKSYNAKENKIIDTAEDEC